ncbi:MAG: hypothetical protein JSU72_17435 [Deltaproteobacteria bacterium]|nr:MAG: hypothetical protein JSU72_17435 [Deltaproteobacteria bacterium]
MSKKRVLIDNSMGTLFASKWLLERDVLRTTQAIIPIKWKNSVNRKSKNSAQRFHQYPTKHIIHKAIEWQGMLDEGLAESLNDIAKVENLSRARVKQIMDLLKLPAEVKEFLIGLQNPAEIRRYSERRLRNNQTTKVMLKEINNQKV